MKMIIIIVVQEYHEEDNIMFDNLHRTIITRAMLT